MKRSTQLHERALDEEELQRTRTYGPQPINPFTELRQQMDFTVARFAAECDVSKQAMIRLEQGTFNGPLPRVLEYCVKNFSVSELQLTDMYEEFQTQMRKRHKRYFGDFDVLYGVSNVHPLRALRGKRNPTEVAKALCIPQATLVYFERRPVQQKTVPKLLIEVMRQIGYTKSEVEYFERTYANYREYVLEGRAA